MENYESIEQVLENLDDKIVYKTKDSLLTGTLLLIGSAFFFYLISMNEWSNSSIYPHLFLVTGCVFAIIGVLKIFIRKSYFVSSVSGQKLNVSEICIDTSERDKLIRLFTTGKIDEIHLLKRSVNGSLKIRVFSTKDMDICFSQISAYASFEYVNLTPVVRHLRPEADFLDKIKKS